MYEKTCSHLVKTWICYLLQRLLRLQESRQIEEKASRIKDWVSNKLRDVSPGPRFW